jgi:hypothetical protein
MTRVRVPLLWRQGVQCDAPWAVFSERWGGAGGASLAAAAQIAGTSALGAQGGAPAEGQRWATRLMSTFVRE